MPARKQPRKRDAAYWKDVRVDAIKLVEHVGGPNAAELRAKIESMMTTEQQAEAESQQLRDIAAAIESKRKSHGITSTKEQRS